MDGVDKVELNGEMEEARAPQTISRQDTSALSKVGYLNMGFQLRVRLWYDTQNVQYFFTLCILLNFVIILLGATKWGMADKEVIGMTTRAPKSHVTIMAELDFYFIVLFTVELAINMYGNWFWHFWQISKWNHFDFIVIALSWSSPMMSAIRIARVVRLLRVLRVAGKMKSLRTIIATLDRSTASVGAVLSLLIMMMCIYAIFGVNEYRDNDPENFGTLSAAMFSMFQLVTGENWPEIARPLMYGRGTVKATMSGPIFFISFMLLAALTTIELVAAVFLDKMAEAKDYVEEEETLALEEECAKERIVKDRVEFVDQYRAGEITGEELQAKLDELEIREKKLNECHLDADAVEEKVKMDRTMHLSMDMAASLKASVLAPSPPVSPTLGSPTSPASPGNPRRSMSKHMKNEVEAIEILAKLLDQVQAIGDRMQAVEKDMGMTQTTNA